MTGGMLDTVLTLIVVVGVVGILGTAWVLETMARRPLDGTPALMESLPQHTVVAGDGHLALCQELCRSQSGLSVVLPLHALLTPAGARSLDGRWIVRDE